MEKAKSMPPSVKTFAVEGVIGAGKTELCTLLAQRFDARLVLEEAEENPFLSKFYKNRARYAFQTQLWFLVSRYKQFSEALFQQDLFHEITITDYLFAKDRILAGVNLDENEYSLYATVASILEKGVPRVDFVVYLQASTDALMKRIEKRGRPFEFNMDRHYIDQLNQAYNQFFFHYTASPLLIINTANIDFVNNNDEREEVIDQIVDVKPGANFYQPLGAAEYLKILKKTKKESPGPGGETDPAAMD
jgi:deoxyadenosine/deoxycytidine kinase